MGLREIIATNLLSLDLHPSGTDKGTIHSYIDDVYTPIFESGQRFKVIHEIGIMHGASLVVWKKLVPSAKVVGYDIHERELHPLAQKLKQENNIAVVYLDAYDDETIDGVRDEIDLLIDDGPHTIQSQIESLKWIKKLSDGGTLVIEDIAGGIISVRKILRNLPKQLRKRAIYFTMFHRTGRFDDTVLIITKSDKVHDSLQGAIAKNKFWGMKSTFSWIFFRLIYKGLVLINLKHYR